jgi:AraC-like DNA-binding protein
LTDTRITGVVPVIDRSRPSGMVRASSGGTLGTDARAEGRVLMLVRSAHDDHADRLGAARHDITPARTSGSRSTRESMVSVRVVLGLIAAAEHAGVARHQLLRMAGVDASLLAVPDRRLPRADLYRLAEQALELSGDPAFGLHWARRLDDRPFAPLAQLVAHAADLREALALLARFSRLLADEADYVVHERDDRLTVHHLPLDRESPRLRRLSADLVLGGLWRIVRSFSADARPCEVGFEYPAPPERAEYDRFFETSVHFGRPSTVVAFDRALLQAPSPAKDDDVRQALEAIAERRLLQITQRTPLAARAREVLVRRPHPADMESVAHALGLSARSLRRHLEAEGTSYGDVLRAAQATVATELLRDPRRTVQDVAYEMGFSDPTAFHRAFRRWTGTTPKAYRASLLA